MLSTATAPATNPLNRQNSQLLSWPLGPSLTTHHPRPKLFRPSTSQLMLFITSSDASCTINTFVNAADVTRSSATTMNTKKSRRPRHPFRQRRTPWRIQIITERCTDKTLDFTISLSKNSPFRPRTNFTRPSRLFWTSRLELKKIFQRLCLNFIKQTKTSTMTSLLAGPRLGYPMHLLLTASAVLTPSQFYVDVTIVVPAVECFAESVRPTLSRCPISGCHIRSGCAKGVTSSLSPSSLRFPSRSTVRRRARRGIGASAWCRSRQLLPRATSIFVQHNHHRRRLRRGNPKRDFVENILIHKLVDRKNNL